MIKLIGSAYMQFSGKTGVFSYQAGLRGELTHIGIEDRIGSYTNDKNYNRLFPTANLSYRFKEGATLQGSYSKRINRPSLGMIYPFNELTDLNTRYVGNPELNPSYANVFELAFLRSWQPLTFNPLKWLQVNTEYNFRGAKATAQTRADALHSIDFGSSKTFLKDRATIMFDVSNLFELRKLNSRTTGEDYLISQTSIPNASRYRLTLVYRLNLKDNQTIRQAKSGNRN